MLTSTIIMYKPSRIPIYVILISLHCMPDHLRLLQPVVTLIMIFLSIILTFSLLWHTLDCEPIFIHEIFSNFVNLVILFPQNRLCVCPLCSLFEWAGIFFCLNRHFQLENFLVIATKPSLGVSLVVLLKNRI